MPDDDFNEILDPSNLAMTHDDTKSYMYDYTTFIFNFSAQLGPCSLHCVYLLAFAIFSLYSIHTLS